MTFFLVFTVFCTLYVSALATIWRPGYLVLEEPLLGCPCKVQLGGSVSLPTKIAVRIIPMAQYTSSAAYGRPPTTRPGDFIKRTKDYCEEEDIPEVGDFMMVVYSYRPDLFVRLFSVTRPNEICELEVSENNDEQTKSVSTSVPSFARIANGIVVRDEKFAKYNVFFHDRSNEDFECSGSLISARWVLTAAHCRVKRGDKVIVGKYRSFQGDKYVVEKIERHPKFKDEVCEDKKYHEMERELNDIALVRLQTPVKDWLSKAIKINARQEHHKGGDRGIVSGYGLTCSERSKTDEILRKAEVSVIGFDDCKNLLEEKDKNSIERGLELQQHICAVHGKCGRGACKGDSGGPLVEKRGGELIQIGVTSYHPGKCGEPDLPDIYTRVSHFKGWIFKTTNGEVRLSS